MATYDWEIIGQAVEEYEGLSGDARAILRAYLDEIVVDPWKYHQAPDEVELPGRRGRMVPYGDRWQGLVTIHIDDGNAIVYVMKIQWGDA